MATKNLAGPTYRQVMPTFWTGKTGRALRTAGPEAIVVALYLVTSPHSNWLGLYYLPKAFIGHETGLQPGAVTDALAHCVEAGFCQYDESSEMVWVVEMAGFQIGASLNPNDNRVTGIKRTLASLPKSTLLDKFSSHYPGLLHLGPRAPDDVALVPTELRVDSSEAPSKGLRSGIEGASEGPRSQEQNQELEQEQEESTPPSATGELSKQLPPPADLGKRQQERLRQVTEEARQAFNASLAKPIGLLPAVRLLTDTRMKEVKRCLSVARMICQEQYGSERITPQFWADYFAAAAADDFFAGRTPGGPGHENWQPDFQYLTRPDVMAKLFDRALADEPQAGVA